MSEIVEEQKVVYEVEEQKVVYEVEENDKVESCVDDLFSKLTAQFNDSQSILKH